jgi:hypothetical protein
LAPPIVDAVRPSQSVDDREFDAFAHAFHPRALRDKHSEERGVFEVHR